MTIALLVTRGFGNGTLSGSIADVVTRGYTSAAVVVDVQDSEDLLTTYTKCLKLTRTDGEVIGMTELDKDITFGGQVYSAGISYTSTALDYTADLSVNNADVSGFLTLTGLERADLVAGLYDHAKMEFFVYDYVAETKIKDLGLGNIGEVALSDESYTAEYRSLSQKMQQTIGRVCSAECDASLGDARCGVTLATYTVTGSITGVTTNKAFTDSSKAQADDFFNYGLITFTSGLNNGLSREVKSFGSGLFTTHLAFPFDIAPFDTYSVYRGCDKTQATCRDDFDNIINFRGHGLFIIGQDEMLKIGGQ